MPRLTIDGRAVVCPAGSTILDAAGEAGVDIPTLCADERLAPSGACRLCVVAVDGAARPVAAQRRVPALGIEAGDVVRVRSRYGATILPAEISCRVAPGTVFATFHDPAAAVNRLTGDHRDPVTHTPAYKRTAVHLERVDGRAVTDGRASVPGR